MKAFVQRHPLVTYFSITFLISWGGGFVMFIPRIFRGEIMPPMTALLLFPILVISVALTGIILTGTQDGRGGVRNLFSRMGQWRVGMQWYLLALLTPPILILLTLSSLRMWGSPDFVPNFFPLGVLFGIIPGFLEEIGWIGYAFPKMQVRSSALIASILLGVMWGLWHLPVVDSLGAASPHGTYWLPFFLAFISVLTAMRVLIVWIYSNTQSLLLAQLMHVSSTASLVILGPSHVSPSQEALWYSVYAGILWVLVAIVIARYGKQLVQLPM